jgi:hypothetical protein
MKNAKIGWKRTSAKSHKTGRGDHDCAETFSIAARSVVAPSPHACTFESLILRAGDRD